MRRRGGPDRFYHRELHGKNIQRVWRGHVGRERWWAEKRRQVAHQKAMVRSARMMQRVWRGKKGRKEYREKHDDMLAWLAKCNAAATDIQRIVRGHNGKVYVKAWRIVANKSAMKLQQVFRSNRARKFLSVKVQALQLRKAHHALLQAVRTLAPPCGVLVFAD